MNPAAKEAKRKAERPNEYCPVPRCLWRTHRNGERFAYCPRHERSAQRSSTTEAARLPSGIETHQLAGADPDLASWEKRGGKPEMMVGEPGGESGRCVLPSAASLAETRDVPMRPHADSHPAVEIPSPLPAGASPATETSR